MGLPRSDSTRCDAVQERLSWLILRGGRPKVLLGEEVPAQKRDEVGESPFYAAFELKVFEQQHRDEGGPDLSSDRIGGGSDEGLQSEVLFDGLEEQLDLPSLPIDLGDRREARQAHIVVEQPMQFGRSFGSPELRPVKHARTQLEKPLLLRSPPARVHVCCLLIFKQRL